VLRFEVSGEVLATFREALAKLRREADGALDDDAALLLMARQVLGGPVDEGRASYQVAITVCEACQRAEQTGRGEAVEVSPEVVEMARCDAQILPRAHVGGTDSAHVAEHAHTRETKRAVKATQTVPPAVRRSVLLRDQHRCRVPGCRHATFVDVHHIQPREEGGAHEPKNLLTLCSAHHRACHRGALSIEGRAPTALRFRHADGTTYGAAVSANGADARLRAFQALRALGFGEGEARLALRRSATHVGDDAELEPLLRHALGLLTAGALAEAS
jgi:HNH endonuclease